MIDLIFNFIHTNFKEAVIFILLIAFCFKDAIVGYFNQVKPEYATKKDFDTLVVCNEKEHKDLMAKFDSLDIKLDGVKSDLDKIIGYMKGTKDVKIK